MGGGSRRQEAGGRGTPPTDHISKHVRERERELIWECARGGVVADDGVRVKRERERGKRERDKGEMMGNCATDVIPHSRFPGNS